MYACNNPDAVFKFVDGDGDVLYATFDTAYETDNDCEPNDENYEEYNALAFCEKSTGKLFEIAYFNLPDEIWHNSNRII